MKIARLWVSAFDDAANKNYSEALRKLEKIENYDVGVPFSVEFGLLKSFLYVRTSHHKLALETLDVACKILSKSHSYNFDEKEYLKNYAMLVANQTVKHLDKLPQSFFENGFDEQIDYKKFDLGSVAQRLQRNFPLREHPNWASVHR